MSREQDRIKKLNLEHKGITNRLKLKLSKKDIDTGVYIFINKMSPFKLVKRNCSLKKKKLADILTEEMIDNSLRLQVDSDSSDQDESTEFDTEEKIVTAESNEITEFIQNSKEFIRELARGKDTTFNRYSGRLKALRCLTKLEVEETALANVTIIESNRP